MRTLCICIYKKRVNKSYPHIFYINLLCVAVWVSYLCTESLDYGRDQKNYKQLSDLHNKNTFMAAKKKAVKKVAKKTTKKAAPKKKAAKKTAKRA